MNGIIVSRGVCFGWFIGNAIAFPVWEDPEVIRIGTAMLWTSIFGFFLFDAVMFAHIRATKEGDNDE